MMKITPLDIRHKEFNRSMRGYKDLEVDEFLDQIVEEFERMFNENIDFRERVEALEEKISQYKNIEETLQKTLISAQEQAEDLKLNATKEADLILRDAELKARSIINDSYAERQKIQRSVQTLKQKHEELRYQLRSLLEGYMKAIEQDEEYSGEDDYSAELDAGAEEALAEGRTSEEPAAGTDAYSGVNEAVREELSPEIVAGETAASGSQDDAGGGELDESQVRATIDPGSDPEPPAAEIQEPVSFPALHSDSAEDEDDPFADIEIDNTSDNDFDW
jgi:cell division initiation protein